MVQWGQMGDPHAGPCCHATSDEIFNVVDNAMFNVEQNNQVSLHRKKARSLSQHLHIPMFRDVGFGGSHSGIFGVTPFEILHVLLLGVMEISLKCLCDFQTPDVTDSKGKPKKPFQSAEFERRVRILSLASKRHSDRNFPWMFNTGVTALAGIQGQEHIGLSLLTTAALPGVLPNTSLEKSFQCCFGRCFSSCRACRARDVEDRSTHRLSFQKSIWLRGSFCRCVWSTETCSIPQSWV